MTKQICLGCGRWTDIPDGYANCGTCTSRYLTAAFAPRTASGVQDVPGPPPAVSPASPRPPDVNSASEAVVAEGTGGRLSSVAGSENG